jgi:hypothetical protein
MLSETCNWVTSYNKISSSNGTYQYQIVTLPNTTTSSRTCTVTVSQEGGESTTFDIIQEGTTPPEEPECMTVNYTVSEGVNCDVYFNTTNGTQQGNHSNVSSNGSKELCNIAEETELVVSCSCGDITIGGDTGFTYEGGKIVSISLNKSTSPSTPIFYQYSFKSCYSDRQIGLFASNATPSGADSNYAMLSTRDSLPVTVSLNSINGMLVNNSYNSIGTSANIGDSIKVYSVQGQSWTLEGTITLTAEDRSFEYGCVQCNCSNMTISLSKNSDVLVNNDAFTTVTVKSSDGTCPTTWTASNGTTGTTGGIFRVSAIGSYKITPTSCTGKSATFNVKEASIVKNITIKNNFSETINYAGGEGSSQNLWNGSLAGGNSYTFNVTNQDSRHAIYLTNCGYANRQSFGSGGISISIDGDNLEFTEIIQDGSVVVGYKDESSITFNPTTSDEQFNGMVDISHGRYLFEITFQ